MKLLIVGLALFGSLEICQAEETLTEKTQVTANTAKRAVKKSVHRTKEALCGKLTGDNQVQCLAKKAKNHIEESKDKASDKVIEIKNDLNTEKK